DIASAKLRLSKGYLVEAAAAAPWFIQKIALFVWLCVPNPNRANGTRRRLRLVDHAAVAHPDMLAPELASGITTRIETRQRDHSGQGVYDVENRGVYRRGEVGTLE